MNNDALTKEKEIKVEAWNRINYVYNSNDVASAVKMLKEKDKNSLDSFIKAIINIAGTFMSNDDLILFIEDINKKLEIEYPELFKQKNKDECFPVFKEEGDEE